MKTRWITLILHLTSLIQKAKQKLFITTSYKSIFILVEIVFLEIILFFVSIPLYFVQNTTKDTGTKQYRTRRVITLSVLIGIGCLWLIKLIIGLVGLFLFANLPSFQVNEFTRNEPTTTEEKQILETEGATVSNALQPVKVTGARRLPSGSVQMNGTASPATHVLLYVSRDGATSSDVVGMTILRTQADAKGVWSVAPKEQQFIFTKGTYISQGVSFDPEKRLKSPAGQAVSFSVQSQPLSLLTVIRTADTMLNWLGLILIGLGLASTILLT